MSSPAIAYIVVLLLGLQQVCLANDVDHTYKEGDEVVLWYNKVGPYNNPQEVYHYYSLPFCKPHDKKIRKKANNLGVLLDGAELEDSGLAVKFRGKSELLGFLESTR